MQIPTRRTRWLAPAIAATLLAVAFSAPASAADEDDQIPPEVGPTACLGGPQQLSLARMSDTPTTIGETGSFVPLASSGVPVTVPAAANDQFVVRFSGEVALAGQPVPVTVPADNVQLQIIITGGGVTQVMAPLNDPTFTTGVGESNALQACRRLGPGNYTIGVRWRIVDLDANNVLTATMDDWMLSVEQND
ncbi:hypothetical protein [Actinoplanes regularis]|uniref:Uncharacterized protein n=1 Tax=Actinoplanes regularis TaxID=52697 RepID=A0A239JZT8_9ACTN|nr:hypothetical protein [Actinoplanes regularis]GIE92369.1 hypothetical protein Are01nite_88490 [Actinoplanes regularis]SNT10962.1 hypothetical protein SAMN06264365_14015 [Actinoplanes regularis]